MGRLPVTAAAAVGIGTENTVHSLKGFIGFPAENRSGIEGRDL